MLAFQGNTLTEPYEYISEQDPAVDQAVPDFDEKWRLYIEGQGDPPLKPGGNPTVFRLRHLGMRERAALSRVFRRAQMDLSTDQAVLDSACVHYACRLGLVGIENFSNAKGEAVELKFETEGGIRLLSYECLEWLGESIAFEVGIAVIGRVNSSPKS